MPPQSGRADRLEDPQIAEAVRRGWLAPPVLRDAGTPPRAAVAPWAALREELQQDRSNR